MKWNIILFLSILMSCACAPQPGTLPVSPTSVEVEILDSYASPLPDSLMVKTWVIYPELTRGRRIILMGSLIKNGVYLNGIMMQATWQDEVHENGEPNCIVPVIYGKGVCSIDTSAFSTGVYVPVTVEFKYKDATFMGQTGFTP